MPVLIETVKVYNLQEAAKAVGLTAQSVRHYVKRRQIDAVKVSGILLFTERAIREFLEARDPQRQEAGRSA
jgi:DNA-binding transcriptional MerR regulator